MAIQEVGFGNLPNIYISEVSLYDGDTPSGDNLPSLNVHVSTIIHDYERDAGLVSWSKSPIMTKYMKVIVVQSTSKEFTLDITSGRSPLNPKHFTKLETFSEDSVTYQTKSITLGDGVDNFEVTDGGIKLYNISDRFDFHVSHANSDLVYFACAYLDLDEVSREMNLDFVNENINSFHGAVVSEAIFSGGELQNKSYLFSRPNGEVYAGPVHVHPEKGYMIGAQHTDTPHDSLTIKTIDNLKIKDRRNKFLQAISESEERTNPIFGQIYASYNTSGVPNMLFSLDCFSLLKKKTMYGEHLINSNQELTNEMLKRLTIQSLTVTRQKIQSGQGTNKMGTAKAYASKIEELKNIVSTKDAPGPSLKRHTRYEYKGSRRDIDTSINPTGLEYYNQTGRIQELHIDSGYNIRYFEFDDLSITKKTTGTYRYKVDILFNDPTLSYMSSLIKQLKSDFDELESYSNRAAMVINKKLTDTKFTEDFVQSELNTYSTNLPMAPWIKSVETYVKFLSFIRKIDATAQQVLKDQYYGLTNPRTANSETISVFVNRYRQLIVEFNSFFKSEKNIINIEKNIRKNNKFSKNSFFVSHVFQEEIKPSDQSSQLDFLGINPVNVGLAKIDKQTYEDLGNMQMQKMFYDNGSLLTPSFNGLNDSLKSAFSDIDSYSMTYLTPHSIINHSKVIPTYSDSVISMSEVKSAMYQILNKDKRTINTLGFLIASPRLLTTPVAAEQEQRFKKSEDYLYQGHHFVKYAENDYLNVCPEEETDIEQIKDSLADVIENPPCRSMLQYNFFQDNNKLSQILKSGSPEQNLETLRTMPLQVKALFASDSDKVRNNYADSDMNYLCKSETRYYVELNHFAINKIEYLSGYEKDSNERDNILRPIWLPLTNKSLASDARPIICRSNNYENASLGLSRSCTLDIPTANKYFVISDFDAFARTMTPPAQTVSSQVSKTTQSFDKNILYSTSNVVMQPKNTSSLMSRASLNKERVLSTVRPRPSQSNAEPTAPTTTTPRGGY